MFKIVEFPQKLKPFFASIQNQFLWDHFQYARTFVLLIVFAWGRRNVSALCRYLDTRNQPHRSRFNNFLNLNRWNPRAQGDPYYPIPKREYQEVYLQYKKKADGLKDVHFVGRLAEYRYLNMDQVVHEALVLFKEKIMNAH